MGTLAENAAAVKEAQVAIDAAIVAKGGTTEGGLTNAAAAIAAIPSGGGVTVEPFTTDTNGTFTAPEGKAYSPVEVKVDDVWPKPWANDGKTHIWFYFSSNDNLLAHFGMHYISDGHTFEIDWGDGEIQTISQSSTLSRLTFNHIYDVDGYKEVVISGYDELDVKESYQLGQYNSGNFGSMKCARQVEYGGNVVGEMGVYCIGCGVLNMRFPNTVTVIKNNTFNGATSLRSIGDLSGITSINGSASFGGTSLLEDLFFSSKTHTEVEAINGFSYLPNLGTQCVFHCSDGDFYRSGSSLLPMTE